MNINKTTLKEFRVDFNEAVKALEEKYKVDIQMKNIKFGENDFHTKMEVTSLDASGDVVDKAAETFKSKCEFYGFVQSDLGREFTSQGRKFTITGLKTTRYKYPISAKGSDGRNYKFPTKAISFCTNKDQY